MYTKGPLRLLYLVVLEVPVALGGLVNQDNLRTRETPLYSLLGVLAPLYCLLHLVVQGLLRGQALINLGENDHFIVFKFFPSDI